MSRADAYGTIYADQFLPRQHQQTPLHPGTDKRALRSIHSMGVYEGTPSTIIDLDIDLPVTAVRPSVHFTISDPSSYLYFNEERVRFDPSEVHLEEGKLMSSSHSQNIHPYIHQRMRIHHPIDRYSTITVRLLWLLTMTL